MAGRKKGGKFYCETCGAEVAAGSDRCKACGSRFYGVQCPRCGHAGFASDFTAGCPSCGYLGEGQKGERDSAAPTFGSGIRGRKKEQQELRKLSRGFIIISVSLLLLVLSALIYLLVRFI